MSLCAIRCNGGGYSEYKPSTRVRLKAIGFVAIRIYPEFRRQNAKLCNFLYVLRDWSFKSVGRNKKIYLKYLIVSREVLIYNQLLFFDFGLFLGAALYQIGLFKHIRCCRVLICVSSLVYFYRHMF